MSFTVTSALKWWASETPDFPAIEFGDRSISYAELFAVSKAIGRGLSRRGVAPGDRICAIGQNTLEYCLLIAGALQIGAIVAPLNFRFTQNEIVEALQEYQPALILADDDRHQAASSAASALGIPVLRIEAVRDLAEDGPDSDWRPDENTTLGIILTSGSTAKPKGVAYSHRNMVSCATEFALIQPRCTRGSRVLVLGPLSAASGFSILLWFLTVGATVVMEATFDARRELDLIVRTRINTLMGVPIFFEQLAAQPGFESADLSSIHHAQVGGAPVSRELLAKYQRKGVALRHLFGQSESCGSWVARDDTVFTHPEKCGRGGPFTEIKVMDEAGTLLPPGEPGEIVVRGPSVMLGYWNNPDATAATIRDGWLHSGDVGTLDEAGNLTFSHRMKDIIISGGLNISAAEVEQAIHGVSGVSEVAVIPATDAKFGEVPLAVIYARDGNVSPEAIVAHCDRLLANYKVPRYVALEDEPLPKLHSGKIAKVALREKYRDAAQTLPRVR